VFDSTQHCKDTSRDIFANTDCWYSEWCEVHPPTIMFTNVGKCQTTYLGLLQYSATYLLRDNTGARDWEFVSASTLQLCSKSVQWIFPDVASVLEFDAKGYGNCTIQLDKAKKAVTLAGTRQCCQVTPSPFQYDIPFVSFTGT